MAENPTPDEERLALLEAQVAALLEESSDDVSRRGLLRKLGGAAAGGVALAAGGTLLNPSAASASTGAMQYGVANNSDVHFTALLSTNGSYTFNVMNTNPGDTVAAALLGQRLGGSGGAGVEGSSTSSYGKGVYGTATNAGAGVYGEASYDGIGVLAAGGRAQFQIQPSYYAGHPTTEHHWAGEYYLDKNCTKWKCVREGDPGLWVRDGYNPVTPSRAYSSTSVVTAGDAAARSVQILGVGGVPNHLAVSAVAIHLTIVTPTAAGSAAVYATATRPQPFEVANYIANQTTTVAATVKVPGSGKIKVYLSNGQAQIRVDVVGFYA